MSQHIDSNEVSGEAAARAEGVSFFCRPRIEQQPDGSWVAQHPASDWSVSAATEADAIRQLQAEDLRRSQQDPSYMTDRFTRLCRALDTPIPGVYPISREERARINASTDPLAEVHKYADHLDAERAKR